jgi:3-hydroxybutyryl-CoA dehydrogenase
MKIEKIFVMGAGVMGSGIAQVTAQAHYEVVMMDIMDINEDLVKRAMVQAGELGRKTRRGSYDYGEA